MKEGIRFLWKIRGRENMKGGNMNKRGVEEQRGPGIRKSRGKECRKEMKRRIWS